MRLLIADMELMLIVDVKVMLIADMAQGRGRFDPFSPTVFGFEV